MSLRAVIGRREKKPLGVQREWRFIINDKQLLIAQLVKEEKGPTGKRRRKKEKWEGKKTPVRLRREDPKAYSSTEKNYHYVLGAIEGKGGRRHTRLLGERKGRANRA